MPDDPSATATATVHISGGLAAIIFIAYLAIIAVLVAAFWKVFTKAGKPGWYALIPILNTVTLLRIAGKSGWWLLLFAIPFVNIAFIIMTYIALAKAFGRSGGFAAGLIMLPFVFFPILGFGSSRYQSAGFSGPYIPQQYAPAI